MSRAYLRIARFEIVPSPSLVSVSNIRSTSISTSSITSTDRATTHPHYNKPSIPLQHLRPSPTNPLPNPISNIQYQHQHQYLTPMPRRTAHTSANGGNGSPNGGANGENRKGNGNGKGRGKPPQSREVTVSRNLSYLLRHQAADEGIRLDEGGWACVADVVSFCFLLVLVFFREGYGGGSGIGIGIGT